MKKAKQVAPANPLLEAVRFISSAQRSKGNEQATHCMVRYGHIVANDGVLAAGAPIVEHDLNCCPQTDRLRLALEKCGQEYQIVQADSSLFLRSGEFSAWIPLCDPLRLAVAVPDAPVAPLNDEFKAALAVCGSLVKDSATTLLQSCIQLDNGSAISTNGYVILQYWHGNGFPSGLLIPIQFAQALHRIKKPLQSFGFSKKSLTVWFEDRSWLRTTLFTERIPSIEAKLSSYREGWQLPQTFFDEVEQVAKWSEDGKVYVDNAVINSHHPSKRDVGAHQSLPMPYMRQGVSYEIASMKLIAKHATHFDDSQGNMTMFYGPKLRGAIACVSVNPIQPVKPKCRHCGAEEKDGICQNYGCEGGYKHINDPGCAECNYTGWINGEICECEIPF